MGARAARSSAPGSPPGPGPGAAVAAGALLRYGALALPLVFLAVFLLVPLALTVVVSFWAREGVRMHPALTAASYADFLTGVRLQVLVRSLSVAGTATALCLVLAYPIAYFLSRNVGRNAARVALLLFTVPFLVNYVIRTFAWVFLLSRTGPVNSLLIVAGVTSQAVDWLLFGDFAVYVGLITSYMPFMIFPIWLSLSMLNGSLIEASWVLGAGPVVTFLRITLPLSLPGVFAAVIFGFVGTFGENAVPIILGGVGFQLIGNSITSVLDVLNYPLAAAMSTIVIAVMLALLSGWYLLFDARSFLGQLLKWRF